MARRKVAKKAVRKSSGGGRFRWLLRWGIRLVAVGFGVWFLSEAWRFPDVGRVASHDPPLPTTALMAFRAEDAAAHHRPYRIEMTWLPLERISPALRRAVLAAEDDRFYLHQGFDAEEIRDAIEDHAKDGKRLRGASTISQQLAKNLWLGPERNWLRKLREAAYTYALERRILKDRILEVYLNVVEWGPGVFGAEAAARRHFGVSAADLSARQAALLAVALPNPLKRDPAHPRPGLERLADRLLDRMGTHRESPRPEATPSPRAAVATRPPPPRSPAPVASRTRSPTPRAPTPLQSRTPLLPVDLLRETP